MSVAIVNGGLPSTATLTGGGDASAAKQDTGNTSLASIDGKLPAKGQALAAASIPVVLTAAQQTALTPPAAITGFATAAKQPALGTAGTPSADVISVQGVASGTALPVSLPTGGADGDGHLQVDVLSGGGGGVADGADFTADTTQGVAIQGVYQSTHSDATDGDLAIVRVSDDRCLLVKPADVDGNPVNAVADPADNSAFTAGTTPVVPLAGLYDANESDTVTDGRVAAVGITATRALKTSTVLTAGTANIGDVDVLTLPTSGGTPYGNIDVDESEDDVKTSAGTLLWYHLYNAHATDIRYVRFYNATAANTTVGTTATYIGPIPVKAGTGANCAVEIPFSTALCVAATTGVAANDTGAPGANEVIVNLLYK